MMSRSTAAGIRRAPRIFVAATLLCGIAALFGGLATQLRTAIESDATFVAAERVGVEYLRPLTRLVVELGRAQSAAVRGSAVDSVALDAAISGVAAVDLVRGGELRTQQRWTDLLAAIGTVVTEQPRGAAAVDRYGDLLGLAAELARRVGDTSKLILDPALDSYYLMDTVILQLPAAVAAAGRAADKAHLARSTGSSHDGQTISADVAIERHLVAATTAAIGTSVRKAMDETTRTAMVANLTEPLDVFRAAADQLAPPVALKQSDEAPDAGALADAAARVRDAALPLAVAALAELDSLLATRQEGLDTQRISALAFAGAGVVAGVVLLWWSVPPRGRGRGDELAVAAAGDDMSPRDVASVSVQLPAVDARDLLAIEELMHVGRGVRVRPKDEAADAR
jgi:hypothetical protein